MNESSLDECILLFQTVAVWAESREGPGERFLAGCELKTAVRQHFYTSIYNCTFIHVQQTEEVQYKPL